jgi:hypothetical protein
MQTPNIGALWTDATFERQKADLKNHTKDDTLRLIALTPHRLHKNPGSLSRTWIRRWIMLVTVREQIYDPAFSCFHFAVTLGVNTVATDSKCNPVQHRQSKRSSKRFFVGGLLYITNEYTIKQCGHKACPNSLNSVSPRDFLRQFAAGRTIAQLTCSGRQPHSLVACITTDWGLRLVAATCIQP